MKVIKVMIPVFIAVLIVSVGLFLGISIARFANKHTETRYDLQEIQDGTYGIFYRTVSTVPAHNYDVIQFCSSGNIYEFSGEVHITYADVEPYAVVVEYPNIANGDKVHLYAPMGTVIYQENVGVR